MANSFVKYTSDGSTLNYAVPFPYLDTGDVTVTVDGAPTPASFLDTGTIRLASPAPASSIITVTRKTPSASPEVAFNDASIITQSDLDRAFRQALYVAQEAADVGATALVYNDHGVFDALGFPISDIGSPKGGSDAATKAYTDQLFLTSLSQNLAGIALGDMSLLPVSGTGLNSFRTFGQRIADCPTPYDFLAVGDGVADDSIPLQKWLDYGGALSFAKGTFKVTRTLYPKSNSRVVGWGAATLLKLVLPPGSPSIPVIDSRRDKVKVELASFHIDGGGALLGDPVVYGGNPGAPAGILMQSNDFVISDVHVTGTFGNGIMAYCLDDAGLQTNGLPYLGTISGARTLSCGIGDNTVAPLGKNGAGVDIGTGTRITVSDCIDNGSYMGFIADLNGGALCSFVNCYAYNTKMDTRYPGAPGAPSQSGHGFYIGSSYVTITNCHAIFSEGVGFWFDQGVGCSAVGCVSWSAAQHGFLNGMADLVAVACTAASSGFGSSGLYDAWLMIASAFDLSSVQLIGCKAEGTSARWGYNEFGPGRTFNVQIVGGAFSGVLGGVSPGTASAPVALSGGLVTPLVASSTSVLALATAGGTQLQLADTLPVNSFLVAHGSTDLAGAIPPTIQSFNPTGPNSNLSIHQTGAGYLTVGIGTGRLGFYDSQGVTKPTITGSTGGNAALSSLINALVSMGLIASTAT